ncbi:MAG: CatA-like O-acetyltransferase [Aristaeellaceae bacterium]
MRFTPIDMTSWPRVQQFHYFARMAPTGYSLTVRVDVTELRRALKAAGMKFFPVYLWLATACLNRQEAFRVAEQDGVLGIWDTLTPLYPVLHEDDGTVSMMWTAWQEDVLAFCRDYEENQRQFSHVHGFLSQPQTPPPPNAYTISCIPWVSFEHFAVHSYGLGAYYFPSLEAGRFITEGERILMPLSMTCHHATTDGWHVHGFLEDFREEAIRLARQLG